MKTTYLPVMLLASAFVSCMGKKEEIKPSLSQQIIGEWQNTYLKVEMPTSNNTRSLEVLEVTPQNWEKKMKIQPIRTIFNKNRTYHSEHRNLKGTLIYNPAGIWSIKGDTITMMDTYPIQGKCFKYKIAINGDCVEFWGKEDFDADGVKDDMYYGKQKKLVEVNETSVK